MLGIYYFQVSTWHGGRWGEFVLNAETILLVEIISLVISPRIFFGISHLIIGILKYRESLLFLSLCSAIAFCSFVLINHFLCIHFLSLWVVVHIIHNLHVSRNDKAKLYFASIGFKSYFVLVDIGKTFHSVCWLIHKKTQISQFFYFETHYCLLPDTVSIPSWLIETHHAPSSLVKTHCILGQQVFLTRTICLSTRIDTLLWYSPLLIAWLFACSLVTNQNPLHPCLIVFSHLCHSRRPICF